MHARAAIAHFDIKVHAPATTQPTNVLGLRSKAWLPSPDACPTRGPTTSASPGCGDGRRSSRALEAGPRARNVVHHKAADDHIEAVVVERQIGDVGGAHLDALGDTLELGVAQRVLLRVIGLVCAPDVDADGAAVRKQLGSGEQDRAAAASQVE